MDEFAKCPYRPPHSLIHHRLMKHIYKCEETYPPLQVCPYNRAHILKTKGDVKKHIEKCPSKNEKPKNDRDYEIEECKENEDGSFTVVLRKTKTSSYCSA